MHPPPALVGPLRPCPFCGGRAALERDPRLVESVRIACGNSACPVGPRTEYLLARFAGELRAAWNARPAAGDTDLHAADAAAPLAVRPADRRIP